jgi:hypothetical protein
MGWGKNIPPLLNPHNIINNIAIQLRKHALQRLDHDRMFLGLNATRLFRFRRGLAGRCVFRRQLLAAVVVERGAGFLGVLGLGRGL